MTQRPLSRRDATLSIAAGLTAGLCAGVGAPPRAFAQTVSIEVLASGRPGDGNDQLARAVAEGLGNTRLTPRAVAVDVPRDEDALAQFVDGQRPRASLMVLGLSTIGSLLTAGTAKQLDDCHALALLTGERQPIVVPADSPYRHLDDLLEAIRKDASAVTWAGRPIASADHQLAALVTKAAGGDLSKLVYKPFVTAAEVSTEVLTGRSPLGVGAFSEFVQQVKGGTLRALAVASPDRTPGVETVPTLREQGVDIGLVNWRGIVSRNAVGTALIDRYAEALRRVAEFTGWKQLCEQRQWADVYRPADDFGRYIDEERARVEALLKEMGTI